MTSKACLLETIQRADRESLVAVQDLALPPGGRGSRRQTIGPAIAVKVVLENTTAFPWKPSAPSTIWSPPSALAPFSGLMALADRDRRRCLKQPPNREQVMRWPSCSGAGSPDRRHSRCSARSGPDANKFLIAEAAGLVTGSATFNRFRQPTVMRSQPHPRNVNHLLRIDSPCAGGVVPTPNSQRMWGTAPEAKADSRFGISKEQGGVQSARWQHSGWKVLFSPTAGRDPEDGSGFFWRQRLAPGHSHVDMPCSCSRP